jgi:membrane-bound lytic murein transglycosylase D
VFLANLENHDKPLTSWRTYTFKKGDRLDKLAKENGIPLTKLRQANGISAGTKVGPGFQLLLPVKGSAAVHDPLPARFAPPPAPVVERTVRTVMRTLVHTVRRGETLVSIAARYKVSVEDLKRWNAIGRLLAGQKLTIEQPASVTTWTRKPAPATPSVRSSARRTRG